MSSYVKGGVGAVCWRSAWRCVQTRSEIVLGGEQESVDLVGVGCEEVEIVGAALDYASDDERGAARERERSGLWESCDKAADPLLQFCEHRCLA